MRALALGVIVSALTVFGAAGWAADGPVLHVGMRGGGYIPRVLSAEPGATVVWTNDDDHAHTVNADTAGGPQVGKIEAGQSCEWVVPTDACPGVRYYYHCTFHGCPGDGKTLGSGMAGAIVIGKVAGPAVEAATLIGPTGGAFLPTVGVLDKGVFDLSADFYDTDEDSTVPVRALAGIGLGTEIGAIYEFNSASDVWGANFKYVYPLFHNQPFSLGGLYLDERDGDATAWQAYLVHTHTFSKPEAAQTIRATLGVNWTDVDFGADSDSEFRFFGGADVTLVEGLTIGAEMQSASGDLGDAHPLSSVFARYRINDRLRAQVGYTNGSPLGVLAADDHRIFAGLSYAFGSGGYRQLGEGGSYKY